MSSPRYRWWGYVRAVALAQCDLEVRARSDEAEASVGVAAYGAASGGGASPRRTEARALRRLDSQEQRELEAVAAARRAIRARRDSERFLQWVSLVYRDRTHSVTGAALAVERSREWGVRRNGEYLRLIAAGLGLL